MTNSKLTGHRISCKITQAGVGSKPTASIQIYGMTLSAMNDLARTGLQGQEQRRNTVLVEAGDDENGMSVVFTGTIQYAWPDMTNMPNVVFRVQATGSQFDYVKPAEPTSFKGPTPFDTVGKAIAQKAGRVFESTGINKIINDPYFYGSALSQFAELAKTARVAWHDDNEKTLAAWPMDQSRQGGSYEISKANGMVTDPIGTPTGILVKTLFKRSLPFGTKIDVKSIITQANGPWRIQRIEYSLESEMPHGEWFMTIEAQR